MGQTAGRRGSVGKDRQRGTYYVDVNDIGAPGARSAVAATAANARPTLR
jgi:hypothetical protein